MTIGEHIKAERLKKGWNQEELAQLLNVSRSTISSWEVGRNSPDIETIVLISELFSLSLDYLLRGNNNILPTDKQKSFYLKKVKNYFQIADTSNNIMYHMGTTHALPTQKKYQIENDQNVIIGTIKRKRYSFGMYDLPRLYLNMTDFEVISIIKDMEQFRAIYKINGEDLSILGLFLEESFSIIKNKVPLSEVTVEKVKDNFIFKFNVLDDKYEELVICFIFLLSLVYEEEKNMLHLK